MSKPSETSLYAPLKTFLEQQGYEVKSEVSNVDVVATKPEISDPVLVELKMGFSLTLYHQAIARQSISDWVYIAVPRGSGRAFQSSLKGNVDMCRRLGLGLITIRLRDGFVEAHVDPGPYRPRQSKPRKARLLREYERREGDPNTGGSVRTKLVTAYRQDALRCAVFLSRSGPCPPKEVAKVTGVEKAGRMMSDDHYGWFERVSRGVYQLTPNGQQALTEFKTVIKDMGASFTPPE